LVLFDDNLNININPRLFMELVGGGKIKENYLKSWVNLCKKKVIFIYYLLWILCVLLREIRTRKRRKSG